MSHIVDSCPVYKFEGGLASLHTTSDSAPGASESGASRPTGNLHLICNGNTAALWRHQQLLWWLQLRWLQSLIADRQQELLKAFLREDGSKIHAKQSLVTSSNGSQMVSGTNKVGRKPGQRRCPKSVLNALTCDYLTAVVILAAAPTVKAAQQLYYFRPPFLPRPPHLHSFALLHWSALAVCNFSVRTLPICMSTSSQVHILSMPTILAGYMIYNVTCNWLPKESNF